MRETSKWKLVSEGVIWFWGPEINTAMTKRDDSFVTTSTAEGREEWVERNAEK